MTATLTQTVLTVDGVHSPMLQAGPAEATEPAVVAHGMPRPDHRPLELRVQQRSDRTRQDRLRARPLFTPRDSLDLRQVKP